MKASQFLFATLKETPNDADIVSSQLMVRAGLIRKGIRSVCLDADGSSST